MMDAGLCILVGACAFLVVTWLKAVRRGSDYRRPENSLRLDLFMAIVWSGMVLVQLANVLFHREPNGTFALSSLALAAAGSQLLVCGIFAGRLLLRWELRVMKAKSEAAAQI